MKMIFIALKDLTRSFRSVFAVVFMFIIPILVTAMFYVMFGGMKDDDSGFSVPRTEVVIVNLDVGGADFSATMSQFPPEADVQSMGDLIVYVLQDEAFNDLLHITLMDSAGAARLAVDQGEAGVALIIPADLSSTFSELEEQAVLEFYQDPTLTFGPAVVRSILNQFLDGLSGTKIALNLAIAERGSSDPAFIGQIVEAWLENSSLAQDPLALLAVQAPAAEETPEIPLMLRIIGPIMGGMMIFYAYYTGTASAETLLAEEELGTLQRLFSTPTRQSAILGGKLIAVLITVTIQIAVLLLFGALVFNIHWGGVVSILLFSVGTIVSASAFGVFVNSFMKNTKQGGILFGGVLTISGMIGMMPIFTFSSPSDTISKISLIVPQGWAVRGLFQSMQGAATHDLLLTALVLLGWSAAFFVIGLWRFQKRYA